MKYVYYGEREGDRRPERDLGMRILMKKKDINIMERGGGG